MKSHLHKWLADALDAFWLLPAAMVIAGILLAVGTLHLNEGGALPPWFDGSTWIYNGGGTGTRTLLGTIASSMIGVASTAFSITIAALSLAAGQMGPRLLRNFTRNRSNQITPGAFLGTFSYSLMVVRSVRTTEESLSTPHLSRTVCVMPAFACVGTLVYFFATWPAASTSTRWWNWAAPMCSASWPALPKCVIRRQGRPPPGLAQRWAGSARNQPSMAAMRPAFCSSTASAAAILRSGCAHWTSSASTRI